MKQEKTRMIRWHERHKRKQEARGLQEGSKAPIWSGKSSQTLLGNAKFTHISTIPAFRVFSVPFNFAL
jgi:hypothetical protein